MQKERKSGWSGTSWGTIVSFSLVMFMLGLLGVILLFAGEISKYVKENIVLSVILDENSDEARVLELQKRLNINPWVHRTEYVSKDQAARNLQEELGEDFVSFLGYNPLLSSIDVYLKAEFANRDSIGKMESMLLEETGVKEVFYQKSLVDLVNENLRLISGALLGFSAILLFIALALMNNTIRLAMHSQRFLIRSMQLVGATPFFISRPFVLSGILHALAGGLVALLIITGLLVLGRERFADLFILKDYSKLIYVFGSLILLSVIIGGGSTWLAVKRYLRMKTDRLYR